MKRKELKRLLDDGMVMIVLDSRIEEVVVPEEFKNIPDLRLNLSWNFGLPMKINDHGIFTTLTFSGKKFDCIIPWNAIFVVVPHRNGKPIYFPESTPLDILIAEETPEKPKLEVVSNSNPEPSSKPRAKLSVVK
jgi:stringent starvation protein B